MTVDTWHHWRVSSCHDHVAKAARAESLGRGGEGTVTRLAQHPDLAFKPSAYSLHEWKIMEFCAAMRPYAPAVVDVVWGSPHGTLMKVVEGQNLFQLYHQAVFRNTVPMLSREQCEDLYDAETWAAVLAMIMHTLFTLQTNGLFVHCDLCANNIMAERMPEWKRGDCIDVDIGVHKLRCKVPYSRTMGCCFRPRIIDFSQASMLDPDTGFPLARDLPPRSSSRSSTGLEHSPSMIRWSLGYDSVFHSMSDLSLFGKGMLDAMLTALPCADREGLKTTQYMPVIRAFLDLSQPDDLLFKNLCRSDLPRSLTKATYQIVQSITSDFRRWTPLHKREMELSERPWVFYKAVTQSMQDRARFWERVPKARLQCRWSTSIPSFISFHHQHLRGPSSALFRPRPVSSDDHVVCELKVPPLLSAEEYRQGVRAFKACRTLGERMAFTAPRGPMGSPE